MELIVVRYIYPNFYHRLHLLLQGLHNSLFIYFYFLFSHFYQSNYHFNGICMIAKFFEIIPPKITNHYPRFPSLSSHHSKSISHLSAELQKSKFPNRKPIFGSWFHSCRKMNYKRWMGEGEKARGKKKLKALWCFSSKL